MRYAREVLLTIVTTLLSVASIEIGLQLVDYPQRPKMGWDWKTSAYKDGAFTSDQVNEFGYRGQPVQYSDGDYVVLLLGDSLIEAGVQPQAVQPERILQFILHEYGIANAKVFSIASAGWSMDQELLALQGYFSRYRADAVVHWVTPGNDFWEVGNIDRSVTSEPGPLKPTFVLKRDGSLSRYEVSAFRFKTLHLINLVLDRLSGPNWGNSRIAVKEYEKQLPSPMRVSVPKESCPDPSQGHTINSPEAIERSRSHFTLAVVPHSERDDYFLRLTHALQKEIEEQALAHRATYLPIVVDDRAEREGFKKIRCIIAAESGLAYRVDWNALLKASHNDILKSEMIEIFVDDKWYNFVSDADKHFNMFGNFEAFNQVAQAIVERRNRSAEVISTADLINRSKLLSPIGAKLSFILGGGSAGQPLRGFYPEEVHGRWTNGDGEAVFAVDPKFSDGSANIEMTLKIDGHAILPGPQSRSNLEIFLDGKRVDEVSITHENNDKPVCVVFDLRRDQKLLSVRLWSKQRFRPIDLGLGDDMRPLGYLVVSLQVSPTHSGVCD
jgi:hypothetical protein